MIQYAMTPLLLYLLLIASLALGVMTLERRFVRYFTYLPGIVVVYLGAMLLAYTGLLPTDETIIQSSTVLKNNLLLSMLFLMLLGLNLRTFVHLGPKLLLSYGGAVVSLIAAFAAVFWIFGFGGEECGTFAALGASWMGGTANMIAVASALHVSPEALGKAIAADAFNYTLWLIALLFASGFAPIFNRFSGAEMIKPSIDPIACSCTLGPKRYYRTLLLSLLAALLAQIAAAQLPFLGATVWSVVLATLLGLALSFSPLRHESAAQPLSSTMLYLLVALIGSQARFEAPETLLRLILAGSAILLLHGAMMIALARAFRLDLFSISVASLANIGGAASAPLLAAAYDRALVGAAVLMAVMGYLVGTFGGLLLYELLRLIA